MEVLIEVIRRHRFGFDRGADLFSLSCAHADDLAGADIHSFHISEHARRAYDDRILSGCVSQRRLVIMIIVCMSNENDVCIVRCLFPLIWIHVYLLGSVDPDATLCIDRDVICVHFCVLLCIFCINCLACSFCLVHRLFRLALIFLFILIRAARLRFGTVRVLFGLLFRRSTLSRTAACVCAARCEHRHTCHDSNNDKDRYTFFTHFLPLVRSLIRSSFS